MAIADYTRVPAMVSVDTLLNGAAIGTWTSAFAWGSILVTLTDITLFFDEMFAGRRVPFLTSDRIALASIA
jgi:hypothetical protein